MTSLVLTQAQVMEKEVPDDHCDKRNRRLLNQETALVFPPETTTIRNCETVNKNYFTVLETLNQSVYSFYNMYESSLHFFRGLLFTYPCTNSTQKIWSENITAFDIIVNPK
ncbi:hypothetical protein RCL_jg19100.t1 [Rhizophagus clarus]|uniref:Uncharacterized protein n=1 Tax=Rhizophagus clarus TaxID=94130 RepID=A0A8H3QWM1_9GLOM|nr:hypothetical protein RCL_jg19100.t1 [Rhizophagus clarus]